VKQEDSKAPILFIFAMQITVIEIAEAFTKNSMNILEITCITNENLIIKYQKKLTRTKIITIFILLCIDDRELPFNLRNEIIH